MFKSVLGIQLLGTEKHKMSSKCDLISRIRGALCIYFELHENVVILSNFCNLIVKLPLILKALVVRT